MIQFSQVISPSHINIFQSFSPRFSRIPSFLTLPGKYFGLKYNKIILFLSKMQTYKMWRKKYVGFGFLKNLVLLESVAHWFILSLSNLSVMVIILHKLSIDNILFTMHYLIKNLRNSFCRITDTEPFSF